MGVEADVSFPQVVLDSRRRPGPRAGRGYDAALEVSCISGTQSVPIGALGAGVDVRLIAGPGQKVRLRAYRVAVPAVVVQPLLDKPFRGRWPDLLALEPFCLTLLRYRDSAVEPGKGRLRLLGHHAAGNAE
jgi:hypothetical protein